MSTRNLSSGRYDFDRAMYKCSECGKAQVQGFATFLSMNAWHASPSEEDYRSYLYLFTKTHAARRGRSRETGLARFPFARRAQPLATAVPLSVF
eukprot:3974938-Pyramimonas_sp.AAC.1